MGAPEPSALAAVSAPLYEPSMYVPEGVSTLGTEGVAPETTAGAESGAVPPCESTLSLLWSAEKLSGGVSGAPMRMRPRRVIAVSPSSSATRPRISRPPSEEACTPLRFWRAMISRPVGPARSTMPGVPGGAPPDMSIGPPAGTTRR